MPRGNALPVSSYDQRMITALVEGSTREISLPTTSPTATLAIVAKFHQLRSAMRREKHPMLAAAEAAKVTIRTSDGAVWRVGNPMSALTGRTLQLFIVPRNADASAMLDQTDLKPPDAASYKTQKRGGVQPAPPSHQLEPADDPELQRLFDAFPPTKQIIVPDEESGA